MTLHSRESVLVATPEGTSKRLIVDFGSGKVSG
jgi:hypothetical protein